MLHLATNKLIETSGPSWPVFLMLVNVLMPRHGKIYLSFHFLKRYPAAGFAKYVYCSTPLPPKLGKLSPTNPTLFSSSPFYNICVRKQVRYICRCFRRQVWRGTRLVIENITNFPVYLSSFNIMIDNNFGNNW